MHQIWLAEDDYIDDFARARTRATEESFEQLTTTTRSVHFLLKSTEDGTAEIGRMPPPFELAHNLHMIPGRLTVHLYEDKIAKMWSDVYQGDPQAIRVVTKIRDLAQAYGVAYGYEYVIMDTSPSLGMLNKVIISTTDGFLIPCMPDMFSLYGIRNIGKALTIWKKQFDTIYQLLSSEKRENFPHDFVRLLGFTLYNAKKYSGQSARWNLANAHYNYALQIPTAIRTFIGPEVRRSLTDDQLQSPVGGESVMHTHNTLPGMAQKYHAPIWKIPNLVNLEQEDGNTVRGNRQAFQDTRAAYEAFARDLIHRMDSLDILDLL